MSLEVPDYSPIFLKYYNNLNEAIINYVKGNLEGVPENMAFKINPDEPEHYRFYKIEKIFCGYDFAKYLPEMDAARRKLENEVVGDNEDEAFDSGFYGDCDEEWNSAITQHIDELADSGKLW